MQEHYYLPQRCLKTIGTLKYTDNTTLREAHITPINTTKTFTLLWMYGLLHGRYLGAWGKDDDYETRVVRMRQTTLALWSNIPQRTRSQLQITRSTNQRFGY